jgi:hypothetical protein
LIWSCSGGETGGDLVDGLFDALTDLTDAGYIWLMNTEGGPQRLRRCRRPGRGGADGWLALTNSVQVSPDWTATKLVRPRARVGEFRARPAGSELHGPQPTRGAGDGERTAWCSRP